MKITAKIISLFLLVISATSCDDVKDLADITLNEVFEESITIAVSEDAQGVTPIFTKSLAIDFSNQEKINEQLDLIKDVKLNSLTYKISDYSGVDNAVISDASMILGGTTITIADINLNSASANATDYTIDNTEQLNAIGAKMLADKAIEGTLTGTVSGTPVNFKVLFSFDVTVTLNAL